MIDQRKTCYNCYRPKSSCMCNFIKPIQTQTQFIILMHPKEYRKTKNGTGHLTHLSLPNSKIFIGIDFTRNKEINKILNDTNNHCYVLYPSSNAIKLNHQSIYTKNKRNVIFIIDSTWACSKKMLRESKNLSSLPKISFQHTQHSNFKIKTQPNEHCLSTMESTLCILRLLHNQNIENISNEAFDSFLSPFKQMVNYQVNRAKDSGIIRYKKPFKKA